MERRLNAATLFVLFPTVTVIGADGLIDLILILMKATYPSDPRPSISNEYVNSAAGTSMSSEYE
jgi:hypothetical protein